MESLIDKTYRYKFECIDNDKVLTLEFNADIDIYRLAQNIREFLMANSWSTELINKVLKDEEE